MNQPLPDDMTSPKRSRFRNMVASAAPLVATPAVSLWSAMWTFPSVLFSAIVISWGAEAAQFVFSQGLALAILAWLQTLPEFAVEAVIAYNAGTDLTMIPLMTANFTGSIRLLVGLGWPMIYIVAAVAYRRRHGLPIFRFWKGVRGKRPMGTILLDKEHAVEIMFLLPCILYFMIILLRKNIMWFDTVVLIGIYLLYLFILRKLPAKTEEDTTHIDAFPRYMLRQKAIIRNLLIFLCFGIGGAILYFTAHPFVNSMLVMALSLGVSQFFFVQWVAPFLTEFPEKVSAFKWASTVDNAPIAVMNMVSSNINQWTILVAMLPPVYALGGGGHGGMIVFDNAQLLEIFLTICQSLLAFTVLANLEFAWYEALTIFVLWLFQFLVPTSHLLVSVIYLGWVLVYFCKLYIVHRITGEHTRPIVFRYFGEIIGEYVFMRRMGATKV